MDLWTPNNSIKKLNSGTVSAAATLDIVLTNFSQFKTLILKLENWICVTDDVELWLRTSTDGGSSFAAGVADYGFALTGGSGVGISNTDISDSEITIAGGSAVGRGQGNAAGESLSAWVYIHDPFNATLFKRVSAHGVMNDSTGDPQHWIMGGQRLSTADVDAIRLLYESGNISSGVWTLYGIDD